MEREQIELVLSTGKTMFFTWLNNLMVKNQLKIDEDNANILDEVIKEIQKQGYEFKTLDEFKK